MKEVIQLAPYPQTWDPMVGAISMMTWRRNRARSGTSWAATGQGSIEKLGLNAWSKAWAGDTTGVQEQRKSPGRDQ